MGPARGVVRGLELLGRTARSPETLLAAFQPAIFPLIQPMSTNLARPSNPETDFGVFKLGFAKFSLDCYDLRAFEIIDQPVENLGFSKFFEYSTKSPPDRKNSDMGRPRVSKRRPGPSPGAAT